MLKLKNGSLRHRIAIVISRIASLFALNIPSQQQTFVEAASSLLSFIFNENIISMFSSSLLLSSPIEDSNLESFIRCITPTPPSRSLPQSCIQELNSQWQPLDKDIVEYFTLEDLWNCYYEWSAYGAGTPVVLNSGVELMQYYVPYLSAIQIYTNKSVTASRTVREDTDAVEFESDSWSDDSGSDKLSRSLSNNSSRAWDAVSEDSSLEQEGSWPTTNKLGNLYFQYFEMSSPYWRIPLSDKVTELARNHPGLMSLRSVDLLPASWMSVAWYPIYHIPSRKNEKDLSTCFLTYHTLSSSFQDSPVDYDNSCCSEVAKTAESKPKPEGSGTISLTPFGLATYKMQGDLWVKPDTSDTERLINLHCAADSWLKQLNVQHHDFNFFSSHSTM